MFRLNSHGRYTIFFVAVFGLALSSSSEAQVRPHVFGVGTANGGWTLLEPEGYTELMYDRMAHMGATSTRIGASWANIEETRGVYDWSALDQDAALCLSHGIEPYCLIVNTPAWASPTGNATHEYAPLPQYNADFEAFCTALASRYAGQVDKWEFWNEQNGYGWHIDGGFNRVDEYVPFLRMAYYALKAGNPNCMVSIGGLDDPDISPGDPTGWRGANFMRLFYLELADRGWANETIFDAVADHPYHSRQNLTDLRDKLRALHNELAAHGDSDKPIWITEYGWTTKSDDVDEALQAQYFEQYIGILLEPEFSYVTMAASLAISDMETGYDGWGLTDQNLRPKPAFHAFQSIPRSDAPQISHVDWRPINAATIEVTWQTHIPATSQIEFGPTASYGQVTPLDSNLVTQHSVQVTGLNPGQDYHLRALATAPGVGGSSSADYHVRCPDAAAPNGGFEEGVPGIATWWRTTGKSFRTDGAVLGDVRTGDHAQAVITVGGWGGRYLDDVMYTSAAAMICQPYQFSTWTKLIADSGLSDVLELRVGTDPTGGTDPDAPTVIWASPSTTEDVWLQHTISATAEATVVTLFVEAHTLIFEDVWTEFLIDDTTFTASGDRVDADFDQDGDVDDDDLDHFVTCTTGATVAQTIGSCQNADLDDDTDVDQADFGRLQRCFGGAFVFADAICGQ